MSIFEQLSHINTEKYHLTVKKDDLDGRVDKRRIDLIGNEVESEFQSTEEGFRLKFKETRFIAELYIDIEPIIVEPAELVIIQRKLSSESEYTKCLTDSSNPSRISVDIFSFCDEIIIKPETELTFRAIDIYFFNPNDFKEMLADISKIRSVLDELEGEKENYDDLVSENEHLADSAEQLSEQIEELQADSKAIEKQIDVQNDTLRATDEKLQYKEEEIEKRNDQLKTLSTSIQHRKDKLSSLNKDINKYTDTLDGYRDESLKAKRSYFLLTAISLFLIGTCVYVLIEQALNFASKDFHDLNQALSYLIAKAPITAAIVTVTALLYNFTKYCIDIVKNVSDQSLELTKFSVIAKNIVDGTDKSTSNKQSAKELNKQKSTIIGELMAKKWNSEPVRKDDGQTKNNESEELD